jgi:ligand-binding SRPBCC domain-containing protein
MYTFYYESTINTTQEALFAFHLDSQNITKITPPSIKVDLLDAPNPSHEGGVVKIKTTQFFIPLYWEVTIKTLQAPSLLVDEVIASPFSYWQHQHLFKNNPKGGVILKDKVTYLPPFGIFGKIASPMIKWQLKAMFSYRHQATKKILEAHN